MAKRNITLYPAAAKWMSLLLCCFLLHFSPASEALAPISEDSFNQYASPFIEILNAQSAAMNEATEHYPAWMKFLLDERWRHDPEIDEEPVDPKCDSYDWQKSALKTHEIFQLGDSARDYLQRCESELRRPWNNIGSNIIHTMLLRFHAATHPYARMVMVHLPGGVQMKGMLAIKGDGRPRPLVIFRPGIFSNVTELFPERFLLFQLFDESPFNLLVLESTSGPEFIFRNKALRFGGYEEGLQNFYIARQLQQPTEPLHSIISSVHLAAVSMGGNGLLFASLLNSLALDQAEAKTSGQVPPVIRSAVAFCPLVRLRETFDFHLSQSYKVPFMDYWVQSRLKGLDQQIPGFSPDHMFSGLVKYMDNYKSSFTAHDLQIQLPPELDGTKKTYWQLNDFWPLYKNVRTPVMVFATEKDPVVPYALNSSLFAAMDKDSQLQVVPLKEGWHCSLPGAYLWKPMSTLAQSSILQQSPDFKQTPMDVRLPVTDSAAGDTIQFQGFAPSFRVLPGEDSEKLLVQVLDRKSKQVLARVQVPFADFGFAPAPLPKAVSVLERWVQHNVHARVSGVSTGKIAVHLHWLK